MPVAPNAPVDPGPRADAPLDDDAFADLLVRLGPFEPAPRLAVGVSGGADSLALVWLTHRWAKARGGSVLALTVDHRLRPESGSEATQVARTLAAQDIDHTVLTWQDAPAGAGEAQARAARHRLLGDACADRGIAHLLLAHTRDDQAETVLLRFAKGSGPDGLAGMPAVRETNRLRLLRPLLGVAKARLRATCTAAGLTAIEDPSNADPRFARARLRQAAGALATEGLTTDRLVDLAHRCALDRVALEAETADLLAEAVTLDPLGFAVLDPQPLAGVPAAIVHRVVGAVIATLGGADYLPRREALLRVLGDLTSGRRTGARTLGGCRLRFARRITVTREPDAADRACVLVGTPGQLLWDGRFRVTVTGEMLERGPIQIGRAGNALTRCGTDTPAAALASLPAAWRHGIMVAEPRIPHWDPAWRPHAPAIPPLETRFAPRRPLAAPAFGVV